MERLPHTRLTYEESNRQYNLLIRETAARIGDGVSLIDVERGFVEAVARHAHGIKAFLLEDLLHLSELGHTTYVDLVWPHIHRYLSTLLAGAGKAQARL
jgi:hypothetical protein